jgi:hypothetical protein
MASSKTREHQQILPRLNNSDMIANHWAKELLTIFEHTCIKEWRENQQLRVRPSTGLFVVHLRIMERQKKSGYSLVISSSTDILSDETKTYTPDTLILIGSATTDECTLTWWNEKDNAKPLFTIMKNNGNDFILITDYGERLMQYIKFKPDNSKRLNRFLNDNLAYQCLDKTRSKGARNSNKNSAVQSARKKGKLIAGCTVIMERADNIERSTMLDAYKITVSEYDYTKSYRTFVRELKKEDVIEFKKNGDILQVSLMD